MDKSNYKYTKYAVCCDNDLSTINPNITSLIYYSPVQRRHCRSTYHLSSALELNFPTKEDAIRCILDYAKTNQFPNSAYRYSIIRIDRISKYSLTTSVILRYNITMAQSEDTLSLIVKDIDY